MQCAEHSRLHAFYDGELDALSAAEMERHVTGCPDCTARLEDLAQLRDLLRDAAPAVATPARLRGRILQALDQEEGSPVAARWSPTRSVRAFSVGLLGGAGGGAIAASLLFLILVAAPGAPEVGDLVANHSRALLSSHLIDVVSSDQHTVKPWFAGRTEVSPTVADFAAQGYRLLGGRVDYLDHRRAAVLVYQHGAHVIDVSGWPVERGSAPPDTSRNGYHLAFWQVGNVRYCAVSDAGWPELQGLVQLLKGIS